MFNQFCARLDLLHIHCKRADQEFERLQEQGIITPEPFSALAAPIVPILKSNGNIWIGRDCKLTINKASETKTYPLPWIDDIFASLSTGQVFSQLD